VNKRKAMIGWLVYTAAKPMAKRALKSKARSALPGARAGARGPNKAAIVAGAGALAAALVFWRRGSDGGESGPSAR
jgi:hypothetical protein